MFSNILDTTLFHERNASFNFKNVVMVLPYLNSIFYKRWSFAYLKGRMIGIIFKSMLLQFQQFHFQHTHKRVDESG